MRLPRSSASRSVPSTATTTTPPRTTATRRSCSAPTPLTPASSSAASGPQDCAPTGRAGEGGGLEVPVDLR